MACIHSRRNFFVGIGHPRCGTAFTAGLLQSGGLRIRHEHVARNGIVSWMLPGGKYRNPYGDAIGPLSDFRNIFCAVRSPLAAMNSIIPENGKPASLQFRQRILTERSDETLPDPAADSGGILTAVVSYTLWFELCMSFLPDIVFRIDRAEDDALLSDYTGKTVARTEGVNRNARPMIRASRFTPEALAELPPEWPARLAALAEGLGYPEDAEIIGGFVR